MFTMSEEGDNDATETFQEYFGSLVNAIQDPVIAASELYSVKLVTWPIVEKAGTTGLTKSDKNVQLLSAVRSRLATDPSQMDKFIRILDVKLELHDVATEISKTFQGVRVCVCVYTCMCVGGGCMILKEYGPCTQSL